MARVASLAVLLSISLLASQEASAKPRAPRPPKPRPAQAQAGNQGQAMNQFQAGFGQAGVGQFGFGWSPYWGTPAYGPIVGYMPVYGFAPSGFAGSFGLGGMTMTFAAPTVGGQDAFSNPANFHINAFPK